MRKRKCQWNFAMPSSHLIQLWAEQCIDGNKMKYIYIEREYIVYNLLYTFIGDILNDIK